MKTLLVVPHTHWDREWYRPFESYRVRLVRTITRVLEGDLPYFLLDGQTVAVDDFLAIHPEMRDQLMARVRQGRLGVGPWYVLVDEFLVSQEALVRNLLVGASAMAQLGARGGVGYLPDMFGHIAQMPQILRGFGIDSAMLWRGAHPEAVSFNWRGPDGSTVRVAHLPKGYYQTMFMAGTSRTARDEALKNYLTPFAEAPVAWLLSGADHMAPQMDLCEQLTSVTDVAPGWQARVSNLNDVFDTLNPETVLNGELRDPRAAYILPGVLSTRIPLKQANARCQTLLERYVEPLCALAWWFEPTSNHSEALLRHAWTTLMKNHPHDSICGCSIDQVHREMSPRFDAVEQISRELLHEAVGAPEAPIAEPTLYAFNPTNWSYAGWLHCEVDWPLVNQAAPEAIALFDADNRPIPTETLSAADTEVFCAGIDLNPDWHPVRRYALRAFITLPPCGGAQLVARASCSTKKPPPRLPAPNLELTQGALRLSVKDGQVVLSDDASGAVFPQCLNFVDEADAGDSYNFSPLEQDTPCWALLDSAQLCQTDDGTAVLRVTHRLELAPGLDPTRTQRDIADRQPFWIQSEWRMRDAAGGVAVDIHFDNTVRDHRLRAVFGFGQTEGVRVLADSAFGVFERKCHAATELPVAKGIEAVMPEFPVSSFTVLQGSAHHLCIVGEGLHEASFGEATADALAVTILRGVGWLSRDDLRTRGGGAGPRFETPEAQCLGTQHRRFALFTGSGTWEGSLPSVHQFLAPPTILACSGKLFSGSAASVLDPRIVLGALKCAESGEGLIVRLYNPTCAVIDTHFSTELTHGGIARVNLAETVQDGPSFAAGDPLRFKPYEIITLLLRHQPERTGAGEG